MLCLRMMICVSTPGSLMLPSTSTMRPTAPRVAVGQRVISTTTMSLGSADDDCPGRNMHVGGDTPIERHDVAEPGAVGLEASDDGVVRALENPDDASFETARRLALDARRARGRRASPRSGSPLECRCRSAPLASPSSGTTKPKPAGLACRRPANEVRSYRAARTGCRAPVQCRREATSVLSRRLKATRSSRGTFSTRASSRAESGGRPAP